MARKKTKICLVCGKDFLGTASRITCSDACRTALSRLLRNGQKPDYWLMAKTRGQKMPISIDRYIPKKAAPKLSDIMAAEIPKVYDAPKMEAPKDEPAQIAPAPIMTAEQKLALKFELESKIKKINDAPLIPGMHPKLHRMQKDTEIDEIRNQINSL